MKWFSKILSKQQSQEVKNIQNQQEIKNIQNEPQLSEQEIIEKLVSLGYDLEKIAEGKCETYEIATLTPYCRDENIFDSLYSNRTNNYSVESFIWIAITERYYYTDAELDRKFIISKKMREKALRLALSKAQKIETQMAKKIKEEKLKEAKKKAERQAKEAELHKKESDKYVDSIRLMAKVKPIQRLS